MQTFTWKRLATAAATLSLAACANLSGHDKSWTTLYDKDSNLNGYTVVGDANWRIQHGLLQADLITKVGPSYLVTKQSFADQEIYAEFWVDSQTNSGIFIRCQDPKKIGADTCYEINIWDTRPDPSYGTGAIVDVAKVSPMPKAGGQWNTMEITAKGNRLTVKLNGVVTADATDSKLAKGNLALQYGSGIVKFRKVLTRPI
jgi:hypothetical protein